jgi:hypothetical protein
VAIDILDMHDDVLVDLAGSRTPEFSALLAEHDGPLSDDELRVTDDAARRARTETLGKTECGTEPVAGSSNVLVH